MLPTILREVVGKRSLPREPEPDLVMESDDQVAAYAEAGRIDGVMAAAYLFHTAQISARVGGAARVLDLGCGPATQLAQVAQFNPATQFVGVDLSVGMLDSARAHAASQNLRNIGFEQSDITDLSQFKDASFDAVISTMALHHLPTLEHLRRCLREVRRVLNPGGAVYLADFGRLKSLKSVIFFAYMNADRQPHVFSLDYERSLRAAFEFDDIKRVAAEELPADVQVHSTFLSPMLTVAATAPRGISATLRANFAALRTRLPRRYRSDLDDLRLFFRLGGFSFDPFT